MVTEIIKKPKCLWPLVPKRQWPQVRFKDKRAITQEEYQRIIAAEVNPERKAQYQLVRVSI
jgi:hypothetical protein